MERIILKEEVKHTEYYDRDDLISKPGEITAADIMQAIIEETGDEHILACDIEAIRKWLKSNRENPHDPSILVYLTECDITGALITGYLEYEQKESKDIWKEK